jgi:hypothetical protein
MPDPVSVLSAVKVGVTVVSSTIGAAKAALDLRKRIREASEPAKRVLAEFLPQDTDKGWAAFGRGRDKGNINTFYDAIDRSQPLARHLLKRLQEHGFALGALTVLLCGFLAITLLSVGWGTWFTIASLSVLGLIAPRVLGPNWREGLKWDATGIGAFLDNVQPLIDSMQVHVRNIKALFWSPLSTTEVAFLEHYLAARSLVSSLEAATLKLHLESSRHPLFEQYKNSVRDLVAQAIRELVSRKRLDDATQQDQVLRTELQRLGLRDLETVKESLFWKLDFKRLVHEGKRIEDIVSNTLGVGTASDFEHSELINYIRSDLQDKASKPNLAIGAKT